MSDYSPNLSPVHQNAVLTAAAIARRQIEEAKALALEVTNGGNPAPDLVASLAQVIATNYAAIATTDKSGFAA